MAGVTADSRARLVEVVSPAPRSQWAAAVDCDPDVVPTQTPQWLDAIVAFGRHRDASRLYRFADGRELVLPMARTSGLPRAMAGSSSYSPGWGMGGIVGEGIDTEAVRAIVDDLAASRERIRIRPNPLHSAVWANVAGGSVRTVDRRAHVIDLSGGVEEVWNHRLSKTCRRYIRVAEASGLEIEVGSEPRLAGAYHGLLMQSIDRWAHEQNEPVRLARSRARRRDPITKFALWARHLGRGCRFYVASLAGEPVAASVVLIGRNAHETRSAMHKPLASRTSANYLLGWLSIRDAIDAGCRSYHLGETGHSIGLAHFKEKFGGVAHDYAEYRLEPLPLTELQVHGRNVVKRAIGFRDA